MHSQFLPFTRQNRTQAWQGRSLQWREDLFYTMVEILAIQEMRRLGMLNPYAEPFYPNGTTFYGQESAPQQEEQTKEEIQAHSKQKKEIADKKAAEEAATITSSN